ncbi:MAG: RNase H family protein, partial [Nocardioides sp.]
MSPTRVRRPRPADMTVPDGATRVWTDGACSGNPGPGGWAWALDETTHAAGRADHTTNQRMEIQAALEAVRANDGP